MCLRMSKHEITKLVWSLLCALTVLALIVFVFTVAQRNAVAARARREAPVFLVKDEDPSPHIFTTRSLPKDDRMMCSVGNGHIATNVFSKTVYMNGLYNGAEGLSHRARIPSWVNIRLNSTMKSDLRSRILYSLDTNTGTFHVHVDRDWCNVEQRIYAHKFYTRALINQIVITPKNRVGWRDYNTRFVELSFFPGPDSKDIKFEPATLMKIENHVVWHTCGRTNIVEDAKYQEEKTQVCVFWTHAPTHLLVPRKKKAIHTFVMTVDFKKEVAFNEISNVLQEKHDNLFEKHKEEWQKLNHVGNIEVTGNLELAKNINAILYYFLSSLPSKTTSQKPNEFYGLSPGSLSRGGVLLDDYEGHNFWDTEIWMYPTILLFHPDFAEKLLMYRIAMAEAAKDLAIASGHKGIRYPWESAFTGREVTQPCCPEVAEFQHHITGCIAFAARQYIATTGDEKWLNNGGCAMITQIAEFWASRITLNKSTGYFDIKNVMGPDEDHFNITNSVFTNVIAGYALYLGEYASCLCNFSTPRSWGKLAASLSLPYDEKLDYHPQFDGYTRPSMIKQADAVLLGYPLQYPMNQSTLANDLIYYENVTRETGPAMTWGMHAIGHLKIGNSDDAERLFKKGYEGHFREPFHMWTEYRKPRIGAVNFLTGMGGFLQSVIFGYAGVSIHLDRLEILKPRLPPDCTRLKLYGLKYFGSKFTLDIHTTNVTLKIISVAKNKPLVLVIRKNKIPLSSGVSVILHGNGPFSMKRDEKNKCPLPSDRIGQVPYNTSEAIFS